MRVLFLFLFMTLSLFADHDERYRHHFHKDLSHLDLDENQYREIKKILKESKKSLEEFRELKEKVDSDSHKLFVKDEFDVQKYKSINLELEKKAMEIESGMLGKIHKVLSKDQRKRFLYYFEEWEVD